MEASEEAAVSRHKYPVGTTVTVSRSPWYSRSWLVWGFAHIFFLIGFRSRIAVFLEWAWEWLTYARGARLIIGPTGARRDGQARPWARPRAPVLARPLRDAGHGEAVTQIPGDARQLARAIGGARGEAGEGTAHVDPRLGRWARRCRACAKHRASRQASTVDLSIEIGAGQGAVQGSDRILGAALFHASLALGLSRRDEAGRRLRCANSISMRAGMESWRLASASGSHRR
jgi:hypothetical protein